MVYKVIEKTVASRLISYLDENNLHEPFQSAYKRYHSCETALIRAQNDILRALDSHNCVVLLLLDLSSASRTHSKNHFSSFYSLILNISIVGENSVYAHA